MTTIKCAAGCGNDVEVKPGDEGMDHVCNVCSPERCKRASCTRREEQMRARIAELEADNHKIICHILNERLDISAMDCVTQMREQLAAHDAVIKQMRDALEEIKILCGPTINEIADEALSIQPTTEHLDAYVKALIGEPAVFANAYDLQTAREHLDCWCSSSVYYNTPLYALTEQK